MRIAFSGAANTGKSTLHQAFLRKWPMYLSPKETYRDLIRNENLPHSSEMTDESQLKILNSQMLELEKHPPGSKVAFDRCSWDCLAYSLIGNGSGKISDAVMAAIISLVRESVRNLDIIFWVPFSDHIKIVDDDLRDTNLDFIRLSDSVFEELYEHYSQELDSDIFYPKTDCPAIIKMEGITVDDRLSWIGEFISPEGELIETGESILDPENLALYEQIMREQNSELGAVEKLKKSFNQNPRNKS